MALSNSYNFSISEDKAEENNTNNANFKENYNNWIRNLNQSKRVQAEIQRQVS